MAPPIEQTLRPETVNELMLIERINELHRLAYLGRGPSPYSVGDPNKDSIELAAIAPTLRLAGGFRANVEHHGDLRIEARSHGPTSFGLGNYVSAVQLQSMHPGQEVRLFDSIWRSGMHSLAKEVRRLGLVRD